MPYYEYRCNNCSVISAAIHKMDEEYTKPCPYCGKVDYVQILFPPAIQFKGSGFYETDYKKKG